MLKQAILALALGGTFMAGPCLAHAKLQSSSPAKDAHLAEAGDQVGDLEERRIHARI